MKQLPLEQNFVLKNVDVWNAGQILQDQDITVRDGIITEIAPTSAHSKSDTRLAVLPSGVDPQVHMRVPGQSEKETADTALAAALAGGFGAILTMPNTKPVLDTIDVLDAARNEVNHSRYAADVQVLYSAAITRAQRGQDAVDFSSLARAGIAAFTDDGVGVVSDELMRAAFSASADTDLPILQHAEFPGHKGVLAPGPAQERLGLVPAYAEDAEVDMVARDLRLLAEFPGARYHVLHVSSAKSLEIIDKAKQQGLAVTCEVSPHHLLFCAEDIDPNNSAFKMNPPLRSKQDREALRDGLASGLIDFVATDHAPHEPQAKTENFKTSAFGTIGLETALRTLLCLHQQGQFTAQRLVEVFSTAPARFLGIGDQFGEISVGRAFRAILLDVRHPSTPFQENEIYSKSRNSCFLGYPLPGKIRTVYGAQCAYQL